MRPKSPRKVKPKSFAERVRRDPDYLDRYFDLSRAGRFIDNAAPAFHHLSQNFNFTLKPERDNYYPPPAAVDELRAAFYSLPEWELRRIFNGWKPFHISPEDRAYCIGRATDDQVVVALCLGTSADHAWSAIEPWFTQKHTGVEIYVLHGTPKLEAIRELQAALDFVKLHYERAIRGEALTMPIDAGGNFQEPAPKSAA